MAKSNTAGGFLTRATSKTRDYPLWAQFARNEDRMRVLRAGYHTHIVRDGSARVPQTDGSNR